MTAQPDRAVPDLRQRAAYAVWTRDLVRYADLDPNGHVNNGAVNQYFEDGRVDFRRQRMPFLGPRLFTGFAVGRFAATYHAALGWPAAVEVGTVVTRIGRASFELGQGIFRDDLCVATAEVGQVYFDPATGRSQPLPDDVRAALEGALFRG